MRKELALVASFAALFVFIACSAQAMPAASLKGASNSSQSNPGRWRLRAWLAPWSVWPLPPQLSRVFNASLARLVRAKFFAPRPQ